jgi:mono/diheme cytochrome c family protein
MKKKLVTLTAMTAIVIIFANCNAGKKATAAAPPPKITYEANVQNVITTYCSPCHIPGKGGKKKDYTTSGAIKGDIDEIIRRVEMSPGDRGYMPFKNPKLSDSTIAIFKQWKADGFIEK